MKEEIIEIEKKHLLPAEKIVEHIIGKIESTEKYVLTVGGESGSGKSTLAHAIRSVLSKKDFRTVVFHMDDYFKLPPYTNHAEREKDIGNVGVNEVDLEMLQSHVDAFINGSTHLEKPIIHYKANRILSEEVQLSNIQVLIVEGTYVSILENINCKVFMLRNYKETFEDRKRRNRDLIIPFNENVLEIEHQIISAHKNAAEILVDSSYNVETGVTSNHR